MYLLCLPSQALPTSLSSRTHAGDVARAVSLSTSLKGVWPLLDSGGMLVVYSQSVQPLAETLDRLKKQNLVCNPELVDIWYREHQV